ncbi:death-associated protein kinase 1-like [Oscarella lobularis]|uniref:death-associated protein kinase 1-like n=1 Tax=Oscarella lobularis TaxID=121494 RepID=UPI0033138EBA
MTSSASSTIERLITITNEWQYDELKKFLSSEKGFRLEQEGYVREYEWLHAIHLVAGREFETAEKADEWLSYLVVQEKEGIEKEAELGGLRPLHCACKWGNIFGVKWLVSHGADVYAKDRGWGRTPYSCACASSVDTMKKMLYLEEHDCDVEPYDICFAAENIFASSEQAHEVFHYLVNEKGMSVNVTHEGLKRTPLKCACLDGSIFGVKWLISHGANIGTELYELVCQSSVDTLKKMLLLEERGCDVSPRAIFLCAQIQFASCEEACEVFHHLVYVKEMSVNATDAELDTPLHFACEKGSFFAVKWLVEHNATINSVNEDSITPLMRAYEGDSDRLLKVRYLSEKGAECLMTDEEGRTVLFYAIGYRFEDADILNDFDEDKWEKVAAKECSISKGELKDVLQYLVIEKGMNINSVNKLGMTPLLHACKEVDYPLFAIRQLLELGADVTAKDSVSRNALHLIAKKCERFNVPAIDLLIEKGIDATCRDRYGTAPYQLAVGELRMRLRQHYDAARFSVLRQEKARPDSIKVCVFGSEMAGKTTFVNSLLQLNLPPIKPEDRTAGVAIKSGQIPGVGKGSIWDFGAQPTFHSAHGLFFGPSNTMFVLVLRFREGERMTPEVYLLEIGRYWCAFVKAALRMLPSHLRSRLRLLIIGNVIDCREEEGTEASFQLKRVAEILQEEFKDMFKIVDVLEMDCNGCYSVRMADCRRKLKRVHEEMLEAADGVPKLCRAIEEKLRISNEESESPFMTSEKFKEWAEKVLRFDENTESDDDRETDFSLTEEESKISIEYLDSSGIIVNLGPRICLRPLWLCSNVIGPLLAPRYFPFGLKTAKPGMVTRQDIESALRAFENYLKHKDTPSPFSVTANEATEILLYLELCIRSRHIPVFYQIPALLEDSIPGDAWVENPMLNVYRGMRYECANSVDIILPLSFVVFQSRSSRMADTSYEAWKDGVKLVKIVDDKVVECLVTLGIKKSHCCIDVIIRWSSQTACHKLAKQMLNELKEMIVEVCEERSPGVLLNWFYLDSTHLKQLDEDPAIYLSSKVDQKIRKNAMNDQLFSDRPKRHYLSVRDLAITGEEERQVSNPEAMSLVQGPSRRKRRDPTKLTIPCAKRLTTSHYRVAVESEDSAEMASRVVTDRLASPCEGLFPTDNDSVSADLVKTCAVVAPTKWEEIGCLLTDTNTVEEIRERTNGNVSRMIKVLETWKLRTETPTVRKLLQWFKEVGVTHGAIKKKYLELY